MPDRTAENLAIWEEIRDKAESKIAALVERTRASIPNDKSLAQFRTASRVARQFYEILEVRANEWVSEVYKICRDARNNPNDSQTQNFKQAVFDFVIEPFIDEQMVDLMLQAAGFKNMERQLIKRGERELRAYMPERYASLTVTASGCRQIEEKLRTRWTQKLSGRNPSIEDAKTAPALTPESDRERGVYDEELLRANTREPTGTQSTIARQRRPEKITQRQQAMLALTELWRRKPEASYKEIGELADKSKVPTPWPDRHTWEIAAAKREGACKTLCAKARAMSKERLTP